MNSKPLPIYLEVYSSLGGLRIFGVNTTRRIWKPVSSKASLGSGIASPHRVTGVSSGPTDLTDSIDNEVSGMRFPARTT